MIFLEDETEYFCENEKKETRKLSFIGMKIILLHSYFHQSVQGFKFDGDAKEFLESYHHFVKSLNDIFESNPNLLEYYISFSKISLLSICFMSNFQYRIFLLKKLISLKSNDLNFLNIHPSHPEIIYHVFLILISLFISKRGPQQFFQAEILDDEEEEEEINENNNDIKDIKDYIDINDSSQISKLINYIKSQILYFSSRCKSELINLKDFEANIIFRSLTDNGLLSISKDTKKLLSSILSKSKDFSYINADFIDRPFSSSMSEIIQNTDLFNQIISQINEIIDCNIILFQDKSLLYVANPQFFVVNAYLLKLGRIE